MNNFVMLTKLHSVTGHKELIRAGSLCLGAKQMSSCSQERIHSTDNKANCEDDRQQHTLQPPSRYPVVYTSVVVATSLCIEKSESALSRHSVLNYAKRQNFHKPPHRDIHKDVAFRHSALFVDTRINAVIVSARNAMAGSWTVEITPSNAHTDANVDRLLEVCKMPVDKVPDLRGVAEKVEPRPGHPTWNCQDLVLELISRAEQWEVLNLDEGKFDELWMTPDGLVAVD
ncbi:hypothetical protein BKA80DRAFT_252315 [Phyllosticta citrichinensis]